jgi:hypothetical protein
VNFLPPDDAVLITMHTALAGILIVACIAALRRRFRRRGALEASVTRGPQSMATFTGTFATTLALFYAAIDVADAASGHKSFLIAADFIAIGYLFLFNGWFRNLVLASAIELTKES